MQLSCADYTWRLLDHRSALDLIASLGFEAVDIGFFAGKLHVRPEHARPNPARLAGELRERLAVRRLVPADLFVQVAEDKRALAVNHPDAHTRSDAVKAFDEAMVFARELGVPGLTVLAGVPWPGESWDVSAARAAETLARLAETAGSLALSLSVEPEVEGLIDTPEKALELLALTPGLRLTLDYSHLVAGGALVAEIEQLVPHARHVQVRGAAPGVLQAPMTDNTTDFARMVRTLHASGYAGYLATEYVYSRWRGLDRVDTLTETIRLRAVLAAAIAELRPAPEPA